MKKEEGYKVSSQSTTKARNDAHSVVEINSREVKTALLMLLVVYILGTLCLQGFGMVFSKVGADVHAGDSASLISAIPGVVLGIACFVYGALGDFISLRKMTWFGLGALIIGSIGGFFWHDSLFLVILWRSLQTLGYQAAGSAFVVIASKYLTGRDKITYFGLFTAGYQLASMIGVLSAGILSEIDWAWLFLIPLLAVLMIPPLVKSVPTGVDKGGEIDLLGFALFSLGIMFLTLFFSQLIWWEIVLAAVFFLAFVAYINKAANPFLTPAFFKNTHWLKAIALILLFYFAQWCYTPLFNSIGTSVFHISSAQVSLLLLPAYICSAFFGVTSGKFVSKVGKRTALLTAACMQLVGALLLAFFATSSPWMLAIGFAVLNGAYGMMYSPVYDSVLGTLSIEESGRGVGMNDLAMQGFAAIGVAIFGAMTAVAADASKLLFIFSGIIALGIVWILLFSKAIYQKAE